MKQKTVRLIVDLRDAREVEKLHARVRELEDQNAKLKAFANSCEFDLVCQQKINLRLFDYCNDHGYYVPEKLFAIWEPTYKPPL